MEEFGWFVLGGAVVAWVSARRRITPVSKAVASAGLGIVSAALDGMQKITKAVVSEREEPAGTELETQVEETTVTAVAARPARTRRAAKTA